MNDEELDEQPVQEAIQSEDDFDTRLRTLARLTKEVEEQDAYLKDLKAQVEALSYSLAM